jgi:hypothetical protein
LSPLLETRTTTELTTDEVPVPEEVSEPELPLQAVRPVKAIRLSAHPFRL